MQDLPPSNDAIHEWPALRLLQAYETGELSPVEVLDSLVAHVQRWEPQLQALYAPDFEGARDEARASEARWRRGQPLAIGVAGQRISLDGLPMTLKENIATRGTPMPLGTAATELRPATEDAPPAARARELGALLFAKTTMPDYGMLSSGLSSFHPLTRNPWDLRKNPGGSSAGAAAAAAAGYGPLHLGTDIGGSIRLPAGWCGLFGLKPSLGRIPIKPPYAGRVAGPMTRRVEDAALLMAALSRPDWRDGMSLPQQDFPWLDLRLDLRGLRIGLMRDAGWGLTVDGEVVAALDEVARRLADAGCTVTAIGPCSTRAMIDGLDAFWRMRSWLDISALPEARRARVLPYIRAWVDRGAQLTATELFEGYSQMAALRDAAIAACQPFDFVISPTCPVPSFPAEWASPIHDPQRPFEHIAFTLPFNMSEQPAATLNAGFTTAGLPIGVQVVGHRFDDLGVLRLCRQLEGLLADQQRDWPVPPPRDAQPSS